MKMSTVSCQEWLRKQIFLNGIMEMFYPFLDVVVSEFGTQRIMFGSDWPVCLLSCNYNEMLMPINSYFQEFSLTEKKQIMHTNAVNFYSL